MEESEKNRRLLASSLLRSGKPVQAKATLEGCQDLESKFLLGVACIEVGNLREGESALRPTSLKDYDDCLECPGESESHPTVPVVSSAAIFSGSCTPIQLV